MDNASRRGAAAVTVDVSSPHSAEVARYALVHSLTVGRAAEADVRLLDPRVSRLHTRLTLSEQGRLVVEDLDSTNGTGAGGYVLRGDRLTTYVPAVVHVEPFVLVVRQELGHDDATMQTQRRGALQVQLTPDGAISVDGLLITAAPLERRLLEVLALHHPDPVSHSILGDSVWGAGCWAPYMLQNLVRRCRGRLAALRDGEAGGIESLRGTGYRLVFDARHPTD